MYDEVLDIGSALRESGAQPVSMSDLKNFSKRCSSFFSLFDFLEGI